MHKSVFVFCLLLLNWCSIKAVEAFTFPEKVYVYDYPKRNTIAILLPNREEYAGLIIDVIASEDGWLGIDLGSLGVGWVKAGTIGLNTRNYNEMSFNLYEKINTSSSILKIIFLEQTVILLAINDG